MPQKYIGITLPIRRGVTGMFEQSTETLQQVRSNFKNLILTKKGERIAQPELGCDLWKILFEPLSDETLDNARLAVLDATDRWLPFIDLTNFEITKADIGNIINIKCTYRFRNNPNVTDQVSISSTELGLPSAITATLAQNIVQNTVQNINNQVNNAQRIRRPRPI